MFDDLLSGRNVYIFGAGQRGRECLRLLRESKIHVKAFWDNDFTKSNSVIDGINVETPKRSCEGIIIITVWNCYDEIREQLHKLGYAENNIISLDELTVEKRKRDQVESFVYEYPHTIQLPITFLCNFDCVMCGMHHMINRKDFSATELQDILQDKLFTQVESVGVNGGEPFLKPDLIECFQIIINTLPKIKNFNIISNGFFSEKILDSLHIIKKMCAKKNIKVNLSISVDGIQDMQDFHRGKKNDFKNADSTCRLILANKDIYIDNIKAICTITRYNIERINEVMVWAANIGIEVEYNIATVNARIENQNRVKDFSVFSDERAKMLATEFFYCQYKQTRKERYFAIYLYLRKGKRYADCPYMHNEWITLTPDSQISFCATHSKTLGSGLEHSAYQLVQENKGYLKEIKEKHCQTCSHYSYNLNSEGIKMLYDDLYKNSSLRKEEIITW